MREYIQILIWTMLFVIVVEMIFPDTDFKKYIKLITGLLVIYIVFSPILKSKLLSGIAYKDIVIAYQDRLGEPTDALYESVFGKQQEKLNEMRQEQTEKEIIQILEKNLDITVLEASTTFKEGEENWVPENISLVVAYGKREEPTLKIGGKAIRVPQIKIGEKDESIRLEQKNLENQIKSCLKDFYNVDNFNIYITVQKNVYKGGQ